MRPLRQLTLTQSTFPHQTYAVLMNYLGEYCSTCERPLPAEASVWDDRTGYTLQREAMPNDWEHLLLLCPNCYQSQETEPVPAQLLLPHREPTFHLDEQSPFVYELREVQRVYIEGEDDQVNVKLEPETVSCVIVRGTTPAARATIEHFALNTDYYQPAPDPGSLDTLKIPSVDYLAGTDRRLEERTRVWHSAEDLAGRLYDLRQESEPIFDAITQSAALAIAAAGYWSTWATVLWDSLHDRTLLEQLLLPSAQVIDQGIAVPGPGPHHNYPGTRRDWLV